MVLSDFEYYLLDLTPLGVIRGWLSKVASGHSPESHRELLRFNSETLGHLPALPGPKFVYAHIIAPHPPFVFDGNGRAVDPGYAFRFSDGSDFPLGRDKYSDGYRGQVQFVNSQLRTLVDEILRKSPTPPIILLQADHGPGMLTNFNSAKHTCLRERFSVFAAYYLPGINPADVPGGATPVNLFRMVFNHYYSAGLPLLADAHYYGKSGVRLPIGRRHLGGGDMCRASAAVRRLPPPGSAATETSSGTQGKQHLKIMLYNGAHR